MKKTTPIIDFKEGEKVQGFYLCAEKHVRHTRTGERYLDLLLRDRTGQINAKVWDKVNEYSDKFAGGDPVAVSGTVEIFLDRPQLVVKRINRASVQTYGRYGYDPGEIVPSSKKDPKQMWKELMILIKQIRNSHLRNLVMMVYQENKKKLLTHPASVSIHHNYRSGYLEHILSMAKIGEKLAPHYAVSKSLLLSGIMLHDIGKIQEITSDLEASFTDEGHFIGHIVMGRDMIIKSAAKMKGFPKDLLLKLEHIILSHQGRYEWQSPRVPKFAEALLVHLIDNLDAKMNIMKHTILEDVEEGSWTSGRNMFHTPLYKESNGSK
ncbi:MAG: HD domain-containing protein [Candidatus Neomarinimicrobiota bacterium]